MVVCNHCSITVWMNCGSVGCRQCGLVQIIKVGMLHGCLGCDTLARIVDEHFLKK